MLETYLSEQNNFVTLTYREETLPTSATGSPTLNRSHFTLWLKRLREEIYPSKIRYFGVGEYGEKTSRPHYHAIVFGFPPCTRIQTLMDSKTHEPLWEKCCDTCRTIGNTWQLGHIQCGEANEKTAQYVAGYVLKKMTKSDDGRLLGREPEFAAMSRRPGIGAHFMAEVGSKLMEFDLEKALSDAPPNLRHGKKELPLGRYLRRQLRKTIGMEPNAPASTINAAQETLRPMRETAFENSRPFRQEVINEGEQAALNQQTRYKIYSQKKGGL